jgi:predicted AlkP superfamily phosphohydrolase/phosphomutase
MLVGWDGAPPQMVESMAGKGLLPHFAALMERGTFVRALNPYPTITASNWTTLSTGAWPGRHGVTGYNVHHPGDPLDQIYSGFNTAECATEHIWDAAERAGKRCILVHYETSWPPTLQNGITVGGCGPNYQDEFHKITPDIVFSNEDYPGSAATGPVQIDRDGGYSRAELRFRTASGEERAYLATWARGSSELSVSRMDCGGVEIARMVEGAWSATAYDRFLFEGADVDAAFRFRLLHLPGPMDDEFKLLCTSIMPVNAFTKPSGLGAELVSLLGPYCPRGGWESAVAIGPEAYLDYQDAYHEWITGACEHLTAAGDWDLLYTQTHAHDYAHHLFMRGYDPLTGDRGRWPHADCERYMKRAYQSADRMLGRLLACVDDDTLVCVVSDHGAKTWLADVNLREILIEAGLMEVDADSGAVVWERTKAVPQRACYVYVNVRDRDPDGIVAPGYEYEAVRDRVIEALHDYVDPVTGRHPFSLAIRKEEARELGLYGARVGDVVYALLTPYGHEHGQSLSSARFGLGSLEATICLAGPGIKRGHIHEGSTGIQDVVPTLCYVADIPFPDGCEGAIIFDALQNPSFRMAERSRLQRELARWKDAYERQVSITHSRF